MAYAFNDDKSKAVITPRTWTDIPLYPNQTDIIPGSILKYTINVDGSVTIIGNLDFKGTAASSFGYPIAPLPEEIQPKGSAGGGVGIMRNFPIYLTQVGKKRVSFAINAGTQLTVNFLDTVARNDYVIFEATYNPTL